jgi:hypothetical protein
MNQRASLLTSEPPYAEAILVTPPTLTPEAVGAITSLGVGPHVVDEEFVGHFVQATKETIERYIAVDRRRR